MHNDKIKQAHAQRARQFMPFAALRGYEELIADRQRFTEPKRTLSPDEEERLNDMISSLESGTPIQVEYYHRDMYLTTQGNFIGVNPHQKTLVMDTAEIPLKDLYTLSID